MLLTDRGALETAFECDTCGRVLAYDLEAFPRDEETGVLLNQEAAEEHATDDHLEELAQESAELEDVTDWEDSEAHREAERARWRTFWKARLEQHEEQTNRTIREQKAVTDAGGQGKSDAELVLPFLRLFRRELEAAEIALKLRDTSALLQWAHAVHTSSRQLPTCLAALVTSDPDEWWKRRDGTQAVPEEL